MTNGKHLFVEAAGLKDVINASRHGQLAMRDPTGLHLHSRGPDVKIIETGTERTSGE
jgi:hypothetical protein